MGGQAIRQNMVLLCAFLGDEGFEGLAEQGLISSGARAHEIEEQVGAGHLTHLPCTKPTATGGAVIRSDQSSISPSSRSGSRTPFSSLAWSSAPSARTLMETLPARSARLARAFHAP